MDANNQGVPVSEYNYSIPSQVSSDEAVICKRNKQQILRLFNHDFSVYEEIVAEDIWVHGPATGQETRGIEAVKRVDMGYATAYPDAQYKIEDMIAVEDKVVVRWSLQGTHLGERKGLQICGRTQDFPPTNQKFIAYGIHIYRFNKEGKIAESWAMWDRLGEVELVADITLTAKSQK